MPKFNICMILELELKIKFGTQAHGLSHQIFFLWKIIQKFFFLSLSFHILVPRNNNFCHLRGPLSPFKIITDINYYIFLDSQRLDLCILTIKRKIFWKNKKIWLFEISKTPDPPLDLKILIFQILNINFTLYVTCLKNKIHGYLIVKLSKIMIKTRKTMIFMRKMEKNI